MSSEDCQFGPIQIERHCAKASLFPRIRPEILLTTINSQGKKSFNITDIKMTCGTLGRSQNGHESFDLATAVELGEIKPKHGTGGFRAKIKAKREEMATEAKKRRAGDGQGGGIGNYFVSVLMILGFFLRFSWIPLSLKDNMRTTNINCTGCLQRILGYGTKWDILLMLIGAITALVTGVA